MLLSFRNLWITWNCPFYSFWPASTSYDKPYKYLGFVVTQSASSAGFSFLLDKLSSIFSNIDSSLVRSKYKLKIYPAYALPSLHFHLIVHDL